MIPITITTMHDGSLFDIESYGQSIFELLPTIYRVDIGNKTIQLSEEDNEFINRHGNATEVTIHMLCYKDDIDVEKVNF